jgi:nickel-dependent lactate racemase
VGKMDERHITSKIISPLVEEIIIPKNKGNLEMFSEEEEEYLEYLVNKYSKSKLSDVYSFCNKLK